MNKKAVLICVTCIILFICSMFLFVDAIKGIQSINQTINQYTSHDYPVPDLYTASKNILVAQLVFTIFVIIFDIITIVTCFSADLPKTPTILLFITLFILVVQNIVAAFSAVSLIRKFNNPNYVMDSLSVVCLIFLFIVALMLLIAIGCEAKENERASSGLGLTISLFFFVLTIISMVSTTNPDTLATLYNVFFIVTLFTAAGAYAIVFVEDSYHLNKPTSYPSNPFLNTKTHIVSSSTPKTEPRPAPVETNVSPATVDPTVELAKLKKLFDDEIITREEYEAKRKKYVDKL